MDNASSKILVIGAGIGGLAVATALAQAGRHVVVMEQAPEIREEGAGIQISPNGLAVLRALGVENALRAKAPVSQGFVLRDGVSGREVVRMPSSDAQDYLFVHRADLVSLLADAARQAGARIRLLQNVSDVTGGPFARSELANGDQCQSTLVIGADGLHSVVRPALNTQNRPFFTGQVAWRAVVPNDMNHPDEAHVHMGPGRHMVTYPLRGGSLLNIVAVEERKNWTAEGWSHRDDGDNLRHAFAGFDDVARRILSRVDAPGLWGLFRHPVAQNWYGDGLALLGDAAHPTLPFMAQGGNLALEDAWVLAHCLTTISDRQTALAQYQDRRRSRAAAVVKAASNNAWKFHLRNPVIRKTAHHMLGLGERIAPGRIRAGMDWIYTHDVTQAGD